MKKKTVLYKYPMMAQMSYDQQELLDQLPHLDFSHFHSAFKSGFNASINAMEEKALRNAALYFPAEDVKMLGDMGGLVARMFYKASDERGAVLLDIFVFAFITDDLLEKPELRRHNEKYRKLQILILKLVRNESFPEKDYPEWRNLITFSRPIFSKFQNLASPTLFHRFAFQYQEYLQGVDWEASIRSPNPVPDIETCKHVKRHLSGGQVAFVLAEFSREIEVPIAVRAHPGMQKFCSLASDLASYDNDIFSLKKEVRDGVVCNTILFLYLHGITKSLQAAVDRVVHMRKQTEREIISLINDLPQFGRDNAVAQEYISAITRCIGGNFEWCSKSTRYHVASSLPHSKL
eukprot:Phypoly_transcript_10704.p1 GENE.Phypoly_transcript_10704~~Phypoly_transcript_10704.p1  ORF type:complete len:373 (+),score=41.27 Phypoly_transcript_10704:78-1121(+)